MWKENQENVVSWKPNEKKKKNQGKGVIDYAKCC